MGIDRANPFHIWKIIKKPKKKKWTEEEYERGVSNLILTMVVGLNAEQYIPFQFEWVVLVI